MAAPRSSADADEIVSEIHINAAPERVFQALVDPQQVPQWWGQGGVYRCTRFDSDLRAGGKWRSSGVAPNGGKFEVRGEYVEINPPRVLAYTWMASWTGDAKTVVRWELVPASGGTAVKIRHSGLAAYPELAKSYQGWPRMLGWLQVLLERGETVDDRKSV